MKRALRSAILAAGIASTNAAAGQIDLTMTGFADDDGRARIILMEGIEGYSGARPVTLIATAEIKDGQATWSGEVAPGIYAIIAHHDQNANDDLDRPILQLPLEPYGYSNSAWTSVGLPAFDAVAFEVADGVSPQRIPMQTNAFVGLAQIVAVGSAALIALFAVVAFRRRRAAQHT